MTFIVSLAGLIIGFFAWEHTGSFFAVCALFALVSFCAVMKLVFKKRINLTLLFAAVSFCIGVISYGAAVAGGELDGYIDRYCTVTGRIAELPERSGDNFRYVIDARSVKYGDNTEEIKENIIITAPAEFEFNDTVTAEGFIKAMNPAMNEFGFDAQRYYKSLGISYKLYSETVSEAPEPIRSYLPSTFALSVKNEILKLVYDISEGDNAAVFAAVLTGERSGISDGLEDELLKSGGYRFLYYAFLFIFVISLLLELLSEKLPRKVRTYIFIAAVLLVGVFNSDKPVFVKSCLYAAAAVFIRSRTGFVYRPDILCAVIGAMLISNPLLIYNSGFVMSVTSGAMLLIFGDAVKERLKFIKNGYIRSTAAVSLICSVGLMPLAAYYFNVFSPYSMLTVFLYMAANIIIWICFFPAAFMIKLFGAAPVLSQLLSLALSSYTLLPKLILKLPFSYVYLPSPNILIVLIFAAAALTVYLKLRGKKYRYSLICASALAAVFAITQIPRINTAEITFVNVGQGDGAVVSVPYKNTILIDGGGGTSYSDYDPGHEIFVPYLIKHGHTNIDAAFVSHFHQDHVQGIIAAVKELDIHALFVPDSLDGSQYRIELEEAAEKAGTDIYYITEDTRVKFDGGLIADITVPDERTRMSDDENDTSLLINVTFGETGCLFTGDMTDFAEKSLLLKRKVPQAEILKVAHHGSSSSTSAEFVSAVDPDISVISLGADNSYGFPNERVLENLSGTDVYRTDINGDITVIADKEKIKKVKTFR